MKRFIVPTITLLLCACQPGKKEAELPDQSDRWPDSITIQSDSATTHVEKGPAANTVRPISGLRSLKVGDVVDGVAVGAIKCSFHTKDASYSSRQYMWRGRWACLAGLNRDDVAAASQEEISRRFDYIHLAPVTLP
ncbi:hypothetical protein [Rhizobium leguminosarum]|jgi:hypothetical protein|uniref:hypothetical protein n=1 Tax=Rhizobium leguminosarum TaxID=384 RepID=UPI00102F3A3C|nr:hypothetical protein [Rhizobium leguminosarum]TBG92665.1 hypothetical protein ELG73_37895 [Rhizobium leguminosarum]